MVEKYVFVVSLEARVFDEKIFCSIGKNIATGRSAPSSQPSNASRVGGVFLCGLLTMVVAVGRCTFIPGWIPFHVGLIHARLERTQILASGAAGAAKSNLIQDGRHAGDLEIAVPNRRRTQDRQDRNQDRPLGRPPGSAADRSRPQAGEARANFLSSVVRPPPISGRPPTAFVRRIARPVKSCCFRLSYFPK